MLDKLLKMDSVLLTIKAQIAKYTALFEADGEIDATERAFLNALEADVKLIEPKLGKLMAKVKEITTVTEKTEEIAAVGVEKTTAAGEMEVVVVGGAENEFEGIALDKGESSEKIRYNFKKLLEEYKKACKDGSLTEEKAKELIEKMQDAIKDDEKELSETEKVNIESPSVELNEKIKQLKTQIEAEKQEILTLDNSCVSSEDAIRFVLEDIGDPQMFEPDMWRVKRVVKFNPKAKELKYQQKNIHAYTDTPSKGIGKVKDGIYPDVTGAGNWQTRKKAKEMAEKAVEEDFIWVEWVEKITHDIIYNKPLNELLKLGQFIYPDEKSDYETHSMLGVGKMLPEAKKLLKVLADKLNNIYSVNDKTKVIINITYNCGDPRGMTGKDCNDRAKSAINNTILRLKQFG